MIQGIVAGYWHNNGLELYRYAQGKPVRIAGGPVEKLAPVRGTFKKIVLIVSRDRLLHVRKRYPPAAKDKLFQAVALELGELFPFNQPDYYCRVFQSFAAYTELDIWAWESESYDQLKKILPFHYVIPEDVAFSPPVAEMTVWTYGGVTNLLAAVDNRFLSAVSHPADTVSEEDVGRFLKSLEPYGAEIHKIRVNGDFSVALKPAPLMTVINEADRGYPPCLDYIPAKNLREFRVGQKLQFPSYQGLAFRIVIYCLLGYGLMLHLTVKNYERSIQQLQQRSKQADKQIQITEAKKAETVDYSETLRELREKLKAQPSAVSALDILARTLPKGSYLNVVSLNEKNLEILVMSGEPLNVLQTFAKLKEIRNVQLKGPLNMQQKTGLYAFSVTMEVAA